MSSPPSSKTKRWYDANCHCGAIRYRALLPALVAVADPHPVMSCNCAMCTRNGYLNAYPLRDEIRVSLGADEVAPGSERLRNEARLGYYVFGKKETEHVFCLTCGSSLWVDANGGEKGVKDGEDDIVAINVRMLSDIKLEDLKLTFANGRSWDPQYTI